MNQENIRWYLIKCSVYHHYYENYSSLAANLVLTVFKKDYFEVVYYDDSINLMSSSAIVDRIRKEI